MAGAARKCRSVLALSSPLPCRADGCTACKPRLSCDARSPDAPRRLLRPAPRLASKSRHHDSSHNGHIHECGLRGLSRVSRPSSVDSSMDCCMDMLSVYASADPSSQARAKTTSCQHKLVTTHQFVVECPCTPPQTRSCPEKPL